MLVEVKDARQVPGEGFRRWFTDPDLDLIVWFADESQEQIEGFQFCYDKQRTEHALTWRPGRGLMHNKVDDGEHPYGAKRSPTLIADGSIDLPRILRIFEENAGRLEPRLVKYVGARLREAGGR